MSDTEGSVLQEPNRGLLEAEPEEEFVSGMFAEKVFCEALEALE